MPVQQNNKGDKNPNKSNREKNTVSVSRIAAVIRYFKEYYYQKARDSRDKGSGDIKQKK